MNFNTFLASALVLLLPSASLLNAGDKGARSSARSSVNKSSNNNRNTNVNRNTNNNTNVNRNTNTNVNRNTNVNVNRDVNVDVDVNHRGGYYGGGGCCYHSGIGVAAAVTATAVATAIVVGSVVNTLPPACTVVMVNGMTYQQCGSTWYQPQFSGGNTTYVVINAPR
jgi:hypothetical protein